MTLSLDRDSIKARYEASCKEDGDWRSEKSSWLPTAWIVPSGVYMDDPSPFSDLLMNCVAKDASCGATPGMYAYWRAALRSAYRNEFSDISIGVLAVPLLTAARDVSYTPSLAAPATGIEPPFSEEYVDMPREESAIPASWVFCETANVVWRFC